MKGQGRSKNKIRKYRRKRAKGYRAAVIFVLFAAAVIAVLLSPLFDVREIAVEGNGKISADTLIGASGINMGENMFKINIKASKDSIRANPYIESVIIKRNPVTRKVTISVTECTVEAYIPFAGNLVAIDKTGKILEVVPGSAATDAPVINGINLVEYLPGRKISIDEPQKFDIMLMYLDYLRKYELWGKTTVLDLSRTSDVSIVINGKLTVLLGSYEQLDYKFDYLKRIIAQMGEHSKGTINLRNPDNATGKLEK